MVSPTLLPPPPPFPLLLPRIPHAYPTPLPPRHPNASSRTRLKFAARRDWARELEELSEEEAELDQMTNEVQHRGQNFLIPIGRTLTHQEEKTDAQGDADESDESEQDGDANQEGENAETAPDAEPETADEVDLDAEMEDLDQTGEVQTDEDDETSHDDELPEGWRLL